SRARLRKIPIANKSPAGSGRGSGTKEVPVRLACPPVECQRARAGLVQLDAELSCVETMLKIFASELPSAVRAAIRATATRAAIRPYSIAVAPDSSFAKDLRIFSIWVSFRFDIRLRAPSSNRPGQ